MNFLNIKFLKHIHIVMPEKQWIQIVPILDVYNKEYLYVDYNLKLLWKQSRYVTVKNVTSILSHDREHDFLSNIRLLQTFEHCDLAWFRPDCKPIIPIGSSSEQVGHMTKSACVLINRWYLITSKGDNKCTLYSCSRTWGLGAKLL